MKKRRQRLPSEGLFRDRQSVLLLVLSLVLAVFYWSYTVLEQKSLKDLSVPLLFVNVPRETVVVGESLPRVVTVEVQGSPEMLRRLREEDVDAKVDVSKFSRGPQIVELGRENVRLPSSVEFVRVLPRLVHFSLERKRQATLSLEPVFSGHTAHGSQVLGWTIEPPTVRVEGPESILEKLKRAPTQAVSIEGRNQDFQIPVFPTFTDPEVSALEMGPFTLRVAIGEKRVQKTVGPIPVTVLNSSFYTAVNPSTLKVMVEGPASVVSVLAPEDFQAEVDVVGLQPSDEPYQLRPAVRFAGKQAPPGTEITSWTQRFVDVKVSRKKPESGGGDTP